MQRMPLIILDDELARSPRGLMNVRVQMHPVSPQRVRNRRHIVGFEVQVEMIALLHKRDKWILLVDQFEMKHLTPRPNQPRRNPRAGIRACSPASWCRSVWI